MKLVSVFLAGGIAATPAIFDNSKMANAILKRQRRNNNGLFEEARAADIVRECHEEICSFDEVLEYYENDEDANKFWDSATKKCSEPDACYRPGTATCVNMWRKRRCECREGWTNLDGNDNCSDDIDECFDENFCNGGTCENSLGGFTCTCPTGWGGARCDEDINECEADTPACSNGGTCSNTEGGFTCECPENWTGQYCEVDVDECAIAAEAGTILCENDGKCMNMQGTFQCICSGGYSGQTCAEDFNECAAGLCPEGTVCKAGESMQSFTCECPERGCNYLDETKYNDLLSQTYENQVIGSGAGSENAMETLEENQTDQYVLIEDDDANNFVEIDTEVDSGVTEAGMSDYSYDESIGATEANTEEVVDATEAPFFDEAATQESNSDYYN